MLTGTHKELKEQVAAGGFREDLFYRLNVLSLRVPSLRERGDDIPLLARFFARRSCERSTIKDKPIDDEVLLELKRYRWPGNVRELQNVMERAIIMSGDRVSLLDLPEEIIAHNDISDHRSEGSPLRDFRDKMEREFILNTLMRNHGNISQSAIELGIGRTYLHRRLASLFITKKDWLA